MLIPYKRPVQPLRAPRGDVVEHRIAFEKELHRAQLVLRVVDVCGGGIVMVCGLFSVLFYWCLGFEGFKV